jgi:hypothetical protein
MTAIRAALVFFAAAAFWPTAMGLLGRALMSPIDRAITDAWCGAPFHSAWSAWGHCAACWTGSAVLAAFGAWLLLGQTQRAVAPTGQRGGSG